MARTYHILQKAPIPDEGRLAMMNTGVIYDIPQDGILDFEATTGAGNANAGILIDPAFGEGSFKQTVTVGLDIAGRFGAKA
jgi:hypothetical protein